MPVSGRPRTARNIDQGLSWCWEADRLPRQIFEKSQKLTNWRRGQQFSYGPAGDIESNLELGRCSGIRSGGCNCVGCVGRTAGGAAASHVSSPSWSWSETTLGSRALQAVVKGPSLISTMRTIGVRARAVELRTPSTFPRVRNRAADLRPLRTDAKPGDRSLSPGQLVSNGGWLTLRLSGVLLRARGCAISPRGDMPKNRVPITKGAACHHIQRSPPKNCPA
jgi:hypothetical protein